MRFKSAKSAKILWPNQALELTRVGKPPLAAQLQRYAAKTRTAVDVYWRSVAVVPIGCRQVQI
jgi:hypothetical protein